MNNIISSVISLAILYALIVVIGTPLMILGGGVKSSNWVDSQFPVRMEMVKKKYTPHYFESETHRFALRIFLKSPRCRAYLGKDKCDRGDVTQREFVNASHGGILDRADELGIKY